MVNAEHHKELVKAVAKEEGITIKRWVLSLIVVIVMAALGTGTTIIIFGTTIDNRVKALEEKVSTRDDRFEVLQKQINTALQVLGDHGTELQSIRTAWQRTDGNIDTLRSQIDSKTQDRYFRSNATQDFATQKELFDAKLALVKQEINELRNHLHDGKELSQ